MTFKALTELTQQFLLERLTFNQLLQYSEPKRVVRSLTVRGPPLQVDAYKDVLYYGFNFKSFPSTTEMRHRGYIKFFKPGRVKDLGDVECIVDCDCEDFRYRWAWVDKQHGSSEVGPSSMNQAFNQAPCITNPSGSPGLCKHILAVRDYIKGQVSDKDFIGTGADTGIMLNDLVARTKRRLVNYPEQMANAKARAAVYRSRRLDRNRGRPLGWTVPDELTDPQAPSSVPGVGPAAGGPLLPGVGRRPPAEESVVNPTKRTMNSKNKLASLTEVEEELDAIQNDMVPGDDLPGDMEGDDDAIVILKDIRDILAKALGQEEPEELEPEELGPGEEDHGTDDLDLDNLDSVTNDGERIGKMRGT
jgi:hypothetical protein